jgi:hypothetical protein
VSSIWLCQFSALLASNDASHPKRGILKLKVSALADTIVEVASFDAFIIKAEMQS